MSDDKALTLAQQINDLYQKVVKTSVGALEHALDAGELLIRAKQTVKADKKGGKWMDWLKENCPKLPQSTANLYMHLAKNREVIENSQRVSNSEAGEGKFSIRSAAKLIPQTPKQIARAEQAKATREANKAEKAEQEKAEAAKHFKSAEDLLQNLDVDELFPAMKNKWTEEQIGKLVVRAEDYLEFLAQHRAAQTQADSNAEEPLAIQPQPLRRPVAPATA